MKTRPSIFWQVLSLSLFVLITALAINTAVVLLAPQPRPAGYTLTEAAKALKTGETRLSNGRILKTETGSDLPGFIPEMRRDDKGEPILRPYEVFLRERLARALNVPLEDVWVDDRPQFYGPYGRRPSRPPTPPVIAHTNEATTGTAQTSTSRQRSGVHSGAPLHTLPENLKQQITFPAFYAAWKMPDGQYRSLIRPKPWLEPWQINLLLGFALTAMIITPVAWLLSQRLTRPITTLARGAAQINFTARARPLTPEGPSEVRAAAEALNAMQLRIRKQMENRTAIIAAIAHDLKTPLAKLRLRVETLPEANRESMVRDIADMDSLIRSALMFASAGTAAQDFARLDLSALVQSLCDDLSELYGVEAETIEDGVTVSGNTETLRRILTNLIENACRYAGHSRLGLRSENGRAIIRLTDQGPGIAPSELEAVLEPFYRVESSRNRDTGGAGLGLSIAQALTESHGGTLKLENGKPTGLVAIVDLPLA
ncbi:sensor histidine kinase [Asticcacaulis tiandongensis]|uniref:sensor histidine kinase n=1 Tax=Asticcacaulis tiandongensis TaxID=2565365 RepID=UPI001125F69A|nr:HAMP domain-containing sensor histidine kinase [Asticcacaulis tiandongensis]